MHRMLCSALIVAAATAATFAQGAVSSQGGATVSTVSPDVVKELAPTGTLRVAINLGNMVLAQGTPDNPRGVTVDLARELGKRLGVPVKLTTYDAAGKAFESMKAGNNDIVFLAIEPVRAAEVAFTAPYVIIEGVYVVPKDSKINSPADVDKPGVRISVNKASAYDLFLTRTIKNATIVRSESGVDTFVRDKLEVVAGVKQPLAAFVKSHPNVRMIEPRFMEIQQAMGTAKGRDKGAAYLKSFVEEMKASGFVADGLKRSNQPDASVAPPARP